VSPIFFELLEIKQKPILEKMSTPSSVETISIGNVASNTAGPGVVSMEASATVPMVLRSPRPKHIPTREI